MKKSANCINFTEIDAGNIVWKTPVQKSSQQAKGINYHELPAKYKYTPNGGEFDFVFDGPQMTSKRGAVLNQYNKWHMTSQIDESNPDHLIFMQKLKEIYDSNVDFIANTNAKHIIGMPMFNPMTAGMVFRFPIFTPTDDKGIPIVGASKLFNPSLINSSFPGSTKKTLFTDCSADLNIIDWAFVRDTQVTYIPRFHLAGDYIGGGKISLQIKMISAIVLDIVDSSVTSQQFEVAEQIRKQDPNAVNKLKDTLARIQLERSKSTMTPSSPNIGLLNSLTPPSQQESKKEEVAIQISGSPPTNNKSDAIVNPTVMGNLAGMSSALK